MKKILSISFVLILALSLTACGETREEKAEKTVDNIVKATEQVGGKISGKEVEILKNALKNSPEFQEEMNKEMAVMPKTLKVATFYRDCLEDADDKDEAIECYEDADEMAREMGLPDDPEEFNADEEFGTWSAEEKEKFLSEMNRDLEMMEQFANMK